MNEIDNEIDNIFFKIDVFKKEVYFFSVSSPSDKKLLHAVAVLQWGHNLLLINKNFLMKRHFIMQLNPS